MADGSQTAKSNEADLLPGSVSRLNAFVPERMAQIENLYHELLAQAEARHKSASRGTDGHLAKTEARHKEQVEELTAQLERMNQLLRDKSISLAESEAQEDELRKRLRQQLKATKKLSRLLDEADDAAARLRSSARWQIANPVAALKAKLSPRSRDLLGYGHLEKIVSTYQKWRTTHPDVAAIDDQIQALISGALQPLRRE